MRISSFKPFLFFLGIIAFVLLTSSTYISQEKSNTSKTKASLNQNDTTPFQTILKVLKSPRCMNCHPSDDQPRQGDDSHVHRLGVVRGMNNQGGPVQTCNTCHHEENNSYTNVPGAPHWGLAPKTMGWHGLSDSALGKAILDKSKNGNRTPEEIVHHMGNDALVLWAWNPGKGRSIPPVPLEEFKKALDEWLAAGTPIPAE